MWISLFIIPHSLIYYLIAFFIFRLLDITKPGFIDSMQDYDGGLGIMMDDIAAGIITFFAIVAIRLVF
jgi:phosphatidylglycerophosphatase A